ncbi:MAG: glycoside hydrolase family 88 protein, partial [Clostridia bacterium]|nr:glycoside hydrolase family 88 protein [Clostridia bacterium]
MGQDHEHERLRRVKQAALAMQRHDWEQGVVAQAFLESGDLETARFMAVEGANRQSADGRCCQLGPGQSATDPCAIGEALIDACEASGDPALCLARDRLLDWALNRAPRSEEGVVYHLCGGREFWVDSFYMLPPFLARAGRYDEALKQINGWWKALYSEEKGLLSHRWDEGARRFVRRDFWGVGNGWALAGLCRVA